MKTSDRQHDLQPRGAAAVPLFDGFGALASELQMPAWLTLPDGHIVTCNGELCGYVGRSAASLVGTSWLDLTVPVDAPVGAAACKADGAAEIALRLRRADGTERWHLLRLGPVKPDRARVVCATDIDAERRGREVAERDNEQLEQALFNQLHEVKRTQSRLQTYFDACPDYLYLLRLSKQKGLSYEDVNPAALSLHGATRGQLLGVPPAKIVDPASAAKMDGEVRRCLRSGQPIGYFADFEIEAGRFVHIQFVGASLEYSNEEEGLVLLCGRDITEQRVVEDALRQSQKMEAVGQLTGGLAHDFNNLLTGIIGSLDLLQMRVSQERFDNLDRYVTAAHGAAMRAASLTHRLLAFSRRQTLDPKPTEANELVVGMEDLLKRTVGPEIALRVTAADGLWTVLVDPSQLENALLNLCINARDAMPGGGRIVIETANAHLDSRMAGERDLPPGDYVSISVTDNGTGIPPEIVARIFDPFFTTKPLGRGTGLGLSMIYGFARQSGGQIRVHSTVGVGTTLRILLPRHDAPPERAQERSVLSAAPRSEAGETVLVVDDEDNIRMLVLEVLEDLGYAALQAVDGAAGVAILRSDCRIDLLVTDVGLPGGMNGRQLAEEGRRLRAGLKILFITGYAENAVLNPGHLESGMQVMTKPFAMETLATRIKLLISEKAA